MTYCAATENGYEALSGKSVGVFVPMFGKDQEGNDIIIKPAEAHIGDFVTLAIAGIVAYHVKNGKDLPITSEEILYEANPKERNELISAIAKLRNEWYQVPIVVSPEMEQEDTESPNA